MLASRRSTGRRSLIVGGALVFALMSFGVAAPPAFAATIRVTTTTDVNDGLCDPHCSLREAVIAANAGPGHDTIEVPGGHYKLTLGGTDEAALFGDLDITTDVTIKTVGGTAIIDGNGSDRVLDVHISGELTVSGIWIVNGFAGLGGGIHNQGTLRLVGTTVYGNAASSHGGGIYSDGDAEVTRSTVMNNEAEFGGGGGMYNIADLEVFDSAVVNNAASDSGGGIRNVGLGARLTLDETSVGGNSAYPVGGGISHAGMVVRIRRSTIANNEAVDGGGVHVADGETYIERSAVTGNRASGLGGGIANVSNGAPVDISTSTVGRNTAGQGGGGVFNGGAGGLTEVVSSSVIGNDADTDANGTGDGGGLNVISGTVTVGNSIVAHNADGSGTTHPDCSGTVSSVDHNIITNATGCTGFVQANDDVALPGVASLGFEGGPTQTHPLLLGAFAANHGPSGAACTVWGTDQRGVPRTSPCSTGAYEQVLCGGILVTIVGTNGNDTLRGTHRADGILALNGNDTVRAGDGNDRVCGGSGKDRLYGGSGHDRLYGSSGKDRLYGEDGNDHLAGGSGRDYMHGGSGNDSCAGGPGRDRKKSC